MKKLKIGVVGGGKIASFFHLPILSCMPNVEVAFIADVQDSRLLARTYDTQPYIIKTEANIAQLPDCDVLLLAIPVGVRLPYYEEFVKRGSAIFSEKPFAVDAESHHALLSLSGFIGSCNYHRVMYSSVRQLKGIIESDVFGSLQTVQITEGGIVGKTGKESASYQNNLKISGGGIVAETACHSFSQLDFLFQRNPLRLDDVVVRYQDDFDVDLKAVLTAENQLQVHYQLSLVRPLENLSIYSFNKAIIRFDHTSPASPLSVYPANGKFAYTIAPDARWALTNYQAFFLRWQNILERDKEKIFSDNNHDTSLFTSTLIEQIYSRTRLQKMGARNND